jgi:hypothetical protein
MATRIFQAALTAALFAAMVACERPGTGPTSVDSVGRPLPQVSIQVAPNPLTATPAGVGTNGFMLQIRANVNFRETAGTGVHINQVTGTITRFPGRETSEGILRVKLGLAVQPMGTASDSYEQHFEVAPNVVSATWRLTATGADALGRPFSVASDLVLVVTPAIEPPAPSPSPTPPLPGSTRLELWGGGNYLVYLGCFSCNEFVTDSVFNLSGLYGSRFSPTSVANHLSQYGSRFSPDSACNEVASNPPIILDTSTRSYSELTVNQFRALAERDPVVVSVLRGYICGL